MECGYKVSHVFVFSSSSLSSSSLSRRGVILRYHWCICDKCAGCRLECDWFILAIDPSAADHNDRRKVDNN